MSTQSRETRMARAAAREVARAAQRRAQRIRAAAFAVVVIAVLVGGVALAAGDLFGPRGTSVEPDAIAVRASMAGFTPSVIEARAGEKVAIDFWTTDAAPHLMGGVHTFISDELAIYEQLPAESRMTFSFTAPLAPGDYDVYCDTCCGGRDSPTMHGTIRVRA